MTPAARVQAAIETLDRVLAGEAAEKALTGWARGSRFAGSKDRAAVRDHVFRALRCWRSYACLGGAATGRGRMIGAFRAAGRDPGEVFTGEGHAPAPLSAEEVAAGAAPVEDADRLDLPPWLVTAFRADLGAEAERTAQALRDRAPVTLRVNLRKATRSDAAEALRREGIETSPLEQVKTALQVAEKNRKILSSDAYRSGMVELQDASSQAAMEAIPLEGGMRVLDYCAGGGGKALALAARADLGVTAHDADPGRMTDLPARADRAGVAITIARRDDFADGTFDLVLCDVPCSGSGTWRRAPDAKWRLTEAALDDLRAVQVEILDRAARIVAPGGRLVYTTCSVLRAENEARIDGFLSGAPSWQRGPERRWPVDSRGDGFYMAQLTRDR